MKTSSAGREGLTESAGMQLVAAELKAAREKRGETLDEVARVTRIGKNYLAAIESADLAKLPSQAYTRGFIRVYAAHLGLSAGNILAMLADSPASADGVNSQDQSAPRRLAGFSRPNGRTIMLAAVLSAALGSAYLFSRQSASDNSPRQSPRSASPPAGKVAAAPDSARQESAAAALPVPSAAAPPENGEQGLILRLKAVSDGRIHITIDESGPQDYDLVNGDIIEWKAADAIRLDLENAASVEGELDGVKLTPFGEAGKAAHIVLKADGSDTK